MGTSSLYSSSSLNSMNSLNKTASALEGLGIWSIIALVLAVCGALVMYFWFLNKKNDGKFKGFVAWLYDMFSFKKMIVEALLKITYLFVTLFLTLYSLGLLFVTPLPAIALLLIGNLGIRIVYEFSLMMVMICRNTSDINSKLNKKVVEEKTEE